MDNFEIPPEYCVMIRAFHRTQSLREAAALLGCDPASLVRKARRASNDFGLLHKIKGRWALTELGLRSVHWLEQSISSQKILLNEKPRLRISTMMWLAEQVLVPHFDSLQRITKNKYFWDIQTARPDFENDLLNGSVDYVISWYPPHDPMVAHRKLYKQKWIIVIPKSWIRLTASRTAEELKNFLEKRPFVRHSDLNPKSAVGFDINIRSCDFLVDSLIAVRAAVEAGHGWSCVPETLVRSSLKQGGITKLNMPTKMDGDLSLWWLRSRKDCEKNIKLLLEWLTQL